jgi:hypothetical protein
MQPRRCRRYAILRTDSGDFADQVTHWAELQRDLVDNMGSWAARQREYADNLDCMLAPFPRGPSRFMTSDGWGAVVVSSAAFSLVPVYELHEVFRIAAR